MTTTTQLYVATGGNRHSSSADWSSQTLAYGAGNNIAVWNPEDAQQAGIASILRGHTNTVNAVRIWQTSRHGRVIVSGSSDHTIRVWKEDGARFNEWLVADAHDGSVNTISIQHESDMFVSGGADATIKIWRLGESQLEVIQTITLKPKFIPLATALTSLSDTSSILAVAGTTSIIQIFVQNAGLFSLQATLTGHEGWIRSMDFGLDKESSPNDLVLASASQDKYIRLWRIKRTVDVSANGMGGLLSNKVHHLGAGDSKWSMWYDALLVGHEDWIATVRWTSVGSSLRLLSASADNSLSMWSKEESGLWLCTTRLGEISSHKGGTTATGSTGGFWIGLWSPDAASVVSLGRTGSWRKWQYVAEHDTWNQTVGTGGHVKEVQQLSWSPDGSYILSTSSDQTARLHAPWRREGVETWHEVGRPQIHGYDLNCVAAVTSERFVSGAEEKLLRVFDQPKLAGHYLASLSGDANGKVDALPDIAAMPVLGLSNKIVEEAQEEGQSQPTIDFSVPPHEDHLSRRTLWPEHEKLYGHGYEISALAVAPSAGIIATACKASTIDHAVIRLFETANWREIKPPLAAHTLTITSLAFSWDSKYLLSVGRDRQWALFRSNASTYESFTSNTKGHSRMILDCSWSGSDYIFATAGRDKSVKVWQIQDESAVQIATISASAAVTAVAFSLHNLDLVYGTEEGELVLVRGADQWQSSTSIDRQLCPSAAITSIRWRPGSRDIVAVASEDSTLRMLKIVD